jgi:2',3'-cyclic-nucleotide 2'-phosphodiesterase (5'-nucleotidase family)
MNTPRLFSILGFFLAACGGANERNVALPASPPSIAGAMPVRVDGTLEEAPAVSAIVTRYREQLGEKLSVRLVDARAEIAAVGEPSNPLGLLVADEILTWLRAHAGTEPAPECFITNDGGLRAPLYAGEVRLTHVYEVMPFDNELVIIELSGERVQAMAVEIARKGGEPIAGLRLRLDSVSAEAPAAVVLEVGGVPFDPQRVYRVATTDYLAESGWLSDVVKGLPIRRTGVLMRDALAERFKQRAAEGRPLEPYTDDRIVSRQP